MPPFDPTPVEVQAPTRLTPVGPNPVAAAKTNGAARRGNDPVQVLLELDLTPAACPRGYAGRQFDVVLNTTVQRAVMKLLTHSLASRDELLLDGRPVKRPTDAVAWLVEQIALGLPTPLLDRLMEEAA